MTSKVPARGRGSRAASCRECGTLREDGAVISARGLCMECGEARSNAASRQLAEKHGPHYDEWARGLSSFVDRLTVTPR